MSNENYLGLILDNDFKRYGSIAQNFDAMWHGQVDDFY